MSELAVQLASAWRATSGIEIIAAVLAVAYLVLAIRQRRSCWVAACVSSCLYIWVLFGARLYMESVLQAFYAAMAVYGYRRWTTAAGDLPVSRWSAGRQLAALSAVLALALLNSFFLRRFTPAAWPFMDSLVTWSSVFATWLVARKVYENWHWWLVIDAVSFCLYCNRRLYVTTVLFGVYLIMIVIGMRAWRRTLPAAVPAVQLA